MNDDRIALQLYTIRDLAGKDMLGTLGQVAEMGYKAVEFAGFGNASVEDVKARLEELDLRGISMHIGVDDLKTKPDEVLSNARAIGCGYLVVAYVAEERRRTLEQVRELASQFNTYGDLCREAGMRFAYHNHNFEFDPVEDTTMFEILLDSTDPSLVGLELDVFWAQYAGADPVETVQRLVGRVPLLHAKDMEAGGERRDAPVGEGILPWSDILREGAASGVEYFIVEQDNPRNPLQDVAQSLRNLREMLATV
jgi:sugar phosphate isomerase/epimerase